MFFREEKVGRETEVERKKKKLANKHILPKRFHSYPMARLYAASSSEVTRSSSQCPDDPRRE